MARRPRPAVLAALLLLLALGACAVSAPEVEWRCAACGAAPGGEDFALFAHDADALQVIVSSQERRAKEGRECLPPGHLVWFTWFADGSFRESPVEIEGRDGCSFHPHGISMVDREDGWRELYVINHHCGDAWREGCGVRDAEDRDVHSIERFAVDGERLVFSGRLTHPNLVRPNDLVALPDGHLYVTNTLGHGSVAWQRVKQLLRLETGEVVHYDGVSWQTSGLRFSFANGIEASADGERVYIAPTREQKVHAYRRDVETGVLRERVATADVGSDVDNLHWATADRQPPLYVAAHRSLWSLMRHARHATNRAPSRVYKIDLERGDDAETLTSRLLYENDGEPLSAAATGALVGGQLIMSPVFDAGLLHCVPK